MTLHTGQVWGLDTDDPVRLRFAPSPTGDPHVGLVRTALFNYAFAKHYGGTFVFRIEDTDTVRCTEESYQVMLATMRWMGFTWDEGPEVGGPYGPYRQSQRTAIYADVADQLFKSGYAYRCYCTQEELEAAKEEAVAAKLPPGYRGTCRNLSAEQVASREAEGRPSVLRFRMPEEGLIKWTDMVRGELSFDASHVSDYVLVRADSSPLYTLVAPVDDAFMRITHVLRGEDLLPSTPRQIALHRALIELGFSERVPVFGHLPYVMGEGNKKLSKRNPEASFRYYIEEGFLPEGVLNYLALLGWSPGGDQELFTAEQMYEVFDGSRITSNPARFDLKKCQAINADHLRALAPDELARRIVPFLNAKGLVGDPPSDQELAILAAAVPLIKDRMVLLSESVGMIGFLFVPEHSFAVESNDAAAFLGSESHAALEAALRALEALPEWTAATIEVALRTALVDGLGLKPNKAFAPVRVAVTGRRVSPPLFESLELLGRQRTLRRLKAGLAS